MSLAFKVFALSDLGLVREGNEDSGLISSKLVAVADGMGGHAGGEVASTIAITALGNTNEPIYRSGAKIGDQLVVSGLPGASAAGLALLNADKRK